MRTSSRPSQKKHSHSRSIAAPKVSAPRASSPARPFFADAAADARAAFSLPKHSAHNSRPSCSVTHSRQNASPHETQHAAASRSVWRAQRRLRTDWVCPDGKMDGVGIAFTSRNRPRGCPPAGLVVEDWPAGSPLPRQAAAAWRLRTWIQSRRVAGTASSPSARPRSAG